MGATYPTKMLLAFRSGDTCAFPNCAKRLTVDGQQSDPAILGEAAHIAGEKSDAARYDSSMTEDERNHYNNLIYLCGDHHTQIDKQHIDFSIKHLHDIKQKHEQTVRDAMTEAFASVGFPELEEATKWIMKIGPTTDQSNFALVAPDEKIKKNDLGSSSRFIITMGLSVAHDVRSYVESVLQIDDEFPNRLKAGFLEEYFRLRKDGHHGDELFGFMCKFAQRGFRELVNQTAGLAVLIYLFEACEVFEK